MRILPDQDTNRPNRGPPTGAGVPVAGGHVARGTCRGLHDGGQALARLRACEAQAERPAAEGPESLAERLAQSNGVDVSDVMQEFRPRVGKAALQRRDLTRDFRSAMTELCRAGLISDRGQETAAPAILAWLKGESRRVSDVKLYSIYNSISRANARFLLQSAVRWITETGYKGLSGC